MDYLDQLFKDFLFFSHREKDKNSCLNFEFNFTFNAYIVEKRNQQIKLSSLKSVNKQTITGFNDCFSMIIALEMLLFSYEF